MRASLGAAVPYPPRLGQADGSAALALCILNNAMRNAMRNAKTIRLDGELRMQPR